MIINAPRNIMIGSASSKLGASFVCKHTTEVQSNLLRRAVEQSDRALLSDVVVVLLEAPNIE